MKKTKRIKTLCKHCKKKKVPKGRRHYCGQKCFDAKEVERSPTRYPIPDHKCVCGKCGKSFNRTGRHRVVGIPSQNTLGNVTRQGRSHSNG